MNATRMIGLSLFGFLSLALLSADEAVAAKAKKKGADASLFKKLDTNDDGKLSPAEFGMFGKGKAKANDKLFQKLDADNDGFISKAEFDKAGAKLGELKKKKKT